MVEWHFLVLGDDGTESFGSDYRTAYELLQMHGSLYADRPVMEMTSMSGWDRTLGPARYGPHLREQRKLLTRVIGSKSDMVCHPISLKTL